MKHEIHEPPPF